MSSGVGDECPNEMREISNLDFDPGGVCYCPVLVLASIGVCRFYWNFKFECLDAVLLYCLLPLGSFVTKLVGRMKPSNYIMPLLAASGHALNFYVLPDFLKRSNLSACLFERYSYSACGRGIHACMFI